MQLWRLPSTDSATRLLGVRSKLSKPFAYHSTIIFLVACLEFFAGDFWTLLAFSFVLLAVEAGAVDVVVGFDLRGTMMVSGSAVVGVVERTVRSLGDFCKMR